MYIYKNVYICVMYTYIHIQAYTVAVWQWVRALWAVWVHFHVGYRMLDVYIPIISKK